MKNPIVFLFLISVVSAQSQSLQLSQKVDSLVSQKKTQYSIPGLSIAVVSQDKIIFDKGFGVRDINTGQAVDQNTVFHTASLSKLFTAQAVMNLVDNHHFTLDEKISNLIPEFKMADHRYTDITVRQLLNHTSGMPDVISYHWSNEEKNPDALKDFVLSLASTKLKSTPGQDFLYSSMDYDVLGYLIEKITGVSFAPHMKQHILNPAGMTNSDFDYFKIDLSRRSSPHTRTVIPKNIQVRKTYPYNPAHAPSSTLNASSHDLALWIKDVLYSFQTEAPDAKASTMRAMITPDEKFNFVGLGWFIGKVNGEKSYYHFGGDKGFRSYLLVLPEHDMGFVLLANCDYDEDFRQEILHGIVNIVISNKE